MEHKKDVKIIYNSVGVAGALLSIDLNQFDEILPLRGDALMQRINFL